MSSAEALCYCIIFLVSGCMCCSVRYLSIISLSEVDFVWRFISEMTCCLSSEMLNLTYYYCCLTSAFQFVMCTCRIHYIYCVTVCVYVWRCRWSVEIGRRSGTLLSHRCVSTLLSCQLHSSAIETRCLSFLRWPTSCKTPGTSLRDFEYTTLSPTRFVIVISLLLFLCVYCVSNKCNNNKNSSLSCVTSVTAYVACHDCDNFSDLFSLSVFVYFAGFADDTQLYVHCGHENMASTIVRLEHCVMDIDHWMSANRLKLTMDKTELIWTGTRYAVSAGKSSFWGLELMSFYQVNMFVCLKWSSQLI